MKTRNIVAVGALVSASLLAGCAGGATIKTTIGPGSPFCNDLGTFATKAVTLTDAAGSSRAALLQALPPIHDLLVKLQGEAPTGDTINGKPLKADIATVASVYAATIAALQNAGATDPAAVRTALASVDAKQGQALTDAINRLDAYTSPVCKVGAVSPSVSTSTSVPSSVGPVGPAAPSTTAPATATTAPTTPTTSLTTSTT